MMKNVLVPLDGSELAEQALQYAKEITAKEGKITLINVIELPADYEYAMMDVPLTMMTTSAQDREAMQEQYYNGTMNYLNSKAADLRKAGYKVDVMAEFGRPAEIIVEQATTLHADVIVMSTHGRTGFNRWLFGSVAQKVVSLMPCAVMVVPGFVREEASEKQVAQPKKLTQQPAT